MLQCDSLIVKVVPVNRLSACAVSDGDHEFKFAALEHDPQHHMVELGIFITESIFACAEDAEVLSSPWHSVGEKLDGVAANLAVPNGDVQVAFRVSGKWPFVALGLGVLQ